MAVCVSDACCWLVLRPQQWESRWCFIATCSVFFPSEKNSSDTFSAARMGLWEPESVFSGRKQKASWDY